MNILFIGSLNYPPTSPLALDGGVRRMLPLLKHVQKMGHMIIMMLPTLKSSDKYELYEGFHIYKMGPNSNVLLKSLPYVPGSSLILRTTNKLRQLVKNHDIDIIHVFNPTLTCGLPGWFVARLCRKPLVLEFSDLVMHFGIDTGQMNLDSPITRLGLFVQNTMPLRADMVIATNLTGKMLISKGMSPEKISIIPCGASASIFHPDIEARTVRKKYGLEDSVVILYQGLVCKAYGINILLEAMSKVSATNEKAKLMIVGFHRDRERTEFEQDSEIMAFKNRVAQLGIEDKVIFSGPQSPDAIPNFIAASDICVNPMPYTLTCRAGSPIKIFEYMAMAKPIVATQLDSIDGVIIHEETGLLAKPEADDIAQKISLLIENPNIRDNIGRNAREKFIAEYEWEKLGDKLIDAYKQLLENHAKRHCKKKR
ncbi:MAG: glycosyltransferase family 4 protein [Dehalococcoidales bacterium]|nr:glycosyltransferase family 4 protein [Dehalococcoidales bacterium]